MFVDALSLHGRPYRQPRLVSPCLRTRTAFGRADMEPPGLGKECRVQACIRGQADVPWALMGVAAVLLGVPWKLRPFKV